MINAFCEIRVEGSVTMVASSKSKSMSPCACARRTDALISRKVFLQSFCKREFQHKSVNLFLILVIVKDKLTDLRKR